MGKAVLLLTVMGTLFVACASTVPDGNPNVTMNLAISRMPKETTPLPEYVVEPPDELLVRVTDNPDLETRAPVRPDGRVSLPLAGDVAVGGRTVAAIEGEVEQKLARYIRRVDVTVTVTAFRSKRIYVYGEVARPGAYPYTGADTVVSAIAEAGTLDWRAAPNGIQVARGDPVNPTILPVRLKDILIDDDDQTNWKLAPDDIVWVPPTTMVKVGDVMREIFWPVSWLLAPAQVYGTVHDTKDDDD